MGRKTRIFKTATGHVQRNLKSRIPMRTMPGTKISLVSATGTTLSSSRALKLLRRKYAQDSKPKEQALARRTANRSLSRDELTHLHFHGGRISRVISKKSGRK